MQPANQTLKLLVWLALVCAMCASRSSSSPINELNSKESSSIESKYVGPAPVSSGANWYRYLVYNPRERLSLLKRSSSALDTLSGSTFGKRAGGLPVDYMNVEPLLGRQQPAGLKQSPRLLEVRWAPADLYDNYQPAAYLSEA